MAQDPNSMNSTNFNFDDLSSIGSDDVMQDYISSNESIDIQSEMELPASSPKLMADSNASDNTQERPPTPIRHTDRPTTPTLTLITPGQVEAANDGELFVLDRQTYKQLIQDIQWMKKQVLLLQSSLGQDKENVDNKIQDVVPSQDTASMFSQTKPLKWIRHVKTRLQERVSEIKFKRVPEE